MGGAYFHAKRFAALLTINRKIFAVPFILNYSDTGRRRSNRGPVSTGTDHLARSASRAFDRIKNDEGTTLSSDSA
jgi:hypothetical protein